jgi:hypothetical protein
MAKIPYLLYGLVVTAVACLASLPLVAHAVLTGTP